MRVIELTSGPLEGDDDTMGNAKVLVSVSGGVAYIEAIGDVDVLLIDNDSTGADTYAPTVGCYPSGMEQHDEEAVLTAFAEHWKSLDI